MPFKSQAQRRKFYAMANRGQISRETVKEWESATPKGKKLPEKVAMAAFVDELEKMALAERLVRLGATDIPRTPRLLMRKRSPQELAALQTAVESGWNKRITDPILRKALPAIEKIPEHPVTKPIKAYLRFGTKQIAKDPIGITALQLVPGTGATEGYVGGKIALEKLIDRLAPLAKAGSAEKRAFGVSAYSGPLGYGGFQQASHIPPFRSPRLKVAGPEDDEETARPKEKKAYDPSPIKGPGQLGNVDMPGMSKMQTPARQLQESKQVAKVKLTKPDATKAFNFKPPTISM